LIAFFVALIKGSPDIANIPDLDIGPAGAEGERDDGDWANE
jgi:hypothetical protein